MVITECCDWLAPNADVPQGAEWLCSVPASHKNILNDVIQPLDFQYLSFVIYKVRALVLDLLTLQGLWCLRGVMSRKCFLCIM